MQGKFLIGRWMVDAPLERKDEKTAFFADMEHESPQIKFQNGEPDRGEPVRINVNWDACRSRGKDKHRPVVKMVLRVTRIESLSRDAEVRIIETAPGALDGDSFKLLYPTSLHRSNGGWSMATRWLVAVRPDTEALLGAVMRTGEESEHSAYFEPIMPPMSAPVPAWKDDLSDLRIEKKSLAALED